MTKNPRLTITLKPQLAVQLRKLSILTKTSQSSMISEFLESSSEVFERLILVLEAAEKAKQALTGKIGGDMRQAQSKVEAQFNLILGGFNELTEPMLKESKAIIRRVGRGSGLSRRQHAATAEASPTPLSNRGVRYDQNTTKNIAVKPSLSKEKPQKHKKKVMGVQK